MGSPLGNGLLGHQVSVVLDERMTQQGVALREMSRATGIKLTRLGDVLRRGRAITPDEIDLVASQLGMRASEVVVEAEKRLDSARGRTDSTDERRLDGAGAAPASADVVPLRVSNDDDVPDFSAMAAQVEPGIDEDNYFT